ncbi:MAG: HAMP domain-containing sensor histidine kinase [Cytophagales bacterium]|nr:HAMP domain-containing histidine kinase [Bernardetiaceae bacterium]MDW8203862.1 HAMP domain-containing sensor histidine kinase [Cytophagales bacterium]
MQHQIGWMVAIGMLLSAFLLAEGFLPLPLPGINFLMQSVNSRLKAELAQARLQVDEVRQQFEQAEKSGRMLGFQDLNFTGKYPVLVFRNNQLLLWTDNRFWLNREDLNGKFDVQTMSHSGGTFIIYKQSVRQSNGDRIHFAALIPLEVRYKTSAPFLRSGINPDIFPDEKVSISRNPEEGIPVKDEEGRYLFSVLLPDNYHFSGGVSEENLILLLVIGGLLLAGVQVRMRFKSYLAAKRYTDGLILLATFLIGVRLILLLANEPAAFNRLSLFSSSSFASSIVSRSLGDLLINILSIFLISSYCYLYYAHLIDRRQLDPLRSRFRWLAAAMLVVLSHVFFFFHFSLLRNLYFNSQIRLDLTVEPSFDVLKVTSLIIFLLSSLIFFFISHIAMRLSAFLLTNRQHLTTLIVGTGLLAAVVATVGQANIEWYILLLCTVYLLIVSLGKLTRQVKTFNYFSYLYLCLSVAVSAMMGAIATYHFEQQMQLENKRKVALQLVEGGDKLGEFLLQQALKKIQSDQTIINRMLTSYSSKDIIIQKIKKQHINKYFDSYETSILLFDGYGEPYNYYTTYDSLMLMSEASKYRTEYPNILYINKLNGEVPKYVCFTDLLRNGVRIGRIVIELQPKRITPFGMYPSLQRTAELLPEAIEKGMSYAIIVEGKLTHSSSNFNYTPSLLNRLQVADMPANQIPITRTISGFQHLLFAPKPGVLVVVSSPVYPTQNIIANFSFFFLVLLGGKLLILIVYGLRLGMWQLLRAPMSLTARIQIYLNLAFFVPLIVVSVVITSLLNNQNRREIQDAYIEKAVTISTNASIAANMEAYNKGVLSKDKLEDIVSKTAELANVYMNLYSRSGRLLVSNEPFSLQGGLTTDLINPQALAELNLNPQGRTLLSESIGKFRYSSVYVAVRSTDLGDIAGIIGIPFFESQRNAEKRIIGVLSSIMNVFTFIFLAMAVLSYLASRVLTEPLRMITKTIGRTSLNKPNEPLNYASADEIGLLVDAYNRMLKQLEESKEALSRSEKESAWREMARQVAHEIKNPLTPMKLTIQHLQRVLTHENPRIGRSLESLLHQIDTLSDIATSFAAFATMPIPKNEEFEISELLQQTCLLHHNHENAIVHLQLPEGKFFVNGDRQLMGRIITNLIINGIQAVPHGKQPVIEVALQPTANERILISVADNGVGIPENIAAKVFLPNFSTKFSGSGIGLALAKRGVEHAGGRIWFETRMLVGTTFFIELPLLRSISGSGEYLTEKPATYNQQHMSS